MRALFRARSRSPEVLSANSCLDCINMCHPRNGKIDLPLFDELGQTSRDSEVLRYGTQDSWDVCPNSPKSGKSISQVSSVFNEKHR